jgi:hypothetical protein
MMLYLLAEISAGDGAAVMVDEFSRKMKGWVSRHKKKARRGDGRRWSQSQLVLLK